MFIDLLRNRRSIRAYTDRPLEREKIELLTEAVLRAPSSRGINPWGFVFVTDPETITRLAQAKPHGAAFLAKAPLAVVVYADPAKSDVWVEDAAIATLIVHLAAADLGLGSCWIQIRRRPHDDSRSAGQYIAEVLGIPRSMEIEAMVAVGYPVEEKKPHPAASLERDKVSFERYGQRRPG
ncbi:MAG: NAD(P)H-dependent dehydrogenase/reductase [Deltaproteobacteria bacterium]|nr:MAG: NAD(P)H-dependent dehydrogenase/reductase [Deltaproteobacteria bacterium]